jgi:TRAP transporter TAXI family solute receptor
VRLEVNRIAQAALALLTAGVLVLASAMWMHSNRTERLTIAAGAASGESYILTQALKTVVERHYSRIRMDVLETSGTSENLKMLDEGRAQLATAQADIIPGRWACSLAVLYDDALQLLTPADSPIHSFADLRGRAIALQHGGGQIRTFLSVAEHFGLSEADFSFIGANDTSASKAFRDGRAAAIFRVRALGDPTIQELARSEHVRFVAIEQAAAMTIKQPAFRPSSIPKGAYRGNPPLPAEDLPTVAIHRYLLARSTVSNEAIREITGVLIERRQEVMREIPSHMGEVRLLMAQVRRPEPETGLGAPLHPGAVSFYEKDKPSFVTAHADLMGFILTLFIMVGSWIWELRQWIQKKQKNNADKYSTRAVELMTLAGESESVLQLDGIWKELLAMLSQAVHDLDKDSLSEESFECFRSILSIAMDVAKDRRALLTGTLGERGPVPRASSSDRSTAAHTVA